MTDEATENSAFELPPIERSSETSAARAGAEVLMERRADAGIENIPTPREPSDEEARTPPALREYQTYKDQHGRLIDPPQAVTARQAAKDLEDYREKVRIFAGLEQQRAAEVQQAQQQPEQHQQPEQRTNSEPEQPPPSIAKTFERIDQLKSHYANTNPETAAHLDEIRGQFVNDARQVVDTAQHAMGQYQQAAAAMADQNSTDALRTVLLGAAMDVGLNSIEQLVQFANIDPQGPAAQKLAQVAQVVNHIQQQNAVVQQQHQQETARRWAETAAYNNQIADQLIKDDPTWRQRIVPYLESQGITHQSFVAARGTNPLSPIEIVMAHKAMRFDEAEAARRNMRAKPLPPVQRPGVRGNTPSYSETNVDALDRRLSRSGHYKDGAKLLIAQRRAGR
jgi:hypothetical protein